MTITEVLTKVFGVDPNKDYDINSQENDQETPEETTIVTKAQENTGGSSTDELDITELTKMIQKQTEEIARLKQTNQNLLNQTPVKEEPDVDSLILKFGGYNLKEE